MKTARLFKNGQSQAVRLPKAFRFPGRQVNIQRLGNFVVLVPEDDPWKSMFESSRQFSDGFLSVREHRGRALSGFQSSLHRHRVGGGVF